MNDLLNFLTLLVQAVGVGVALVSYLRPRPDRLAVRPEKRLQFQRKDVEP